MSSHEGTITLGLCRCSLTTTGQTWRMLNVGQRKEAYEMIRGSCLCGQVRYEVRCEPEAMYYCHCSMCRKATGSSFATNMLVAEAGFVVVAGTSLIKGFRSSQGETRHFCSECGSPIYSKAGARADIISVRCGGLDDDPGIRPTEHIYIASRAPWFEVHDHLRQYSAQPGV